MKFYFYKHPQATKKTPQRQKYSHAYFSLSNTVSRKDFWIISLTIKNWFCWVFYAIMDVTVKISKSQTYTANDSKATSFFTYPKFIASAVPVTFHWAALVYVTEIMRALSLYCWAGVLQGTQGTSQSTACIPSLQERSHSTPLHLKLGTIPSLA